MTYDPAFRTPQAEVETRMGIQPLEELLAERDDLVKEVAPLRAQHGPGGCFDDLRSVQRSTLAMKHRAKAVESGTKVTESYLDDASRADPDYVAFIEHGVLEKIKHAELENRIAGINDLIRRGDAVARFATQELGLAK